MLLFRKPSPAKIHNFLERQARLDLTYAALGATAGPPPPGYANNHTRCRLGEGAKIFAAASAALQHWAQFRLGWVEACPMDTPLHQGNVIAVLARFAGLWWLNACRIVYVITEPDRFGFAYGTLPDHVGSGEERFLVEREGSAGSVWYDILAYSRPRALLARLGYPLFRHLQRRFGYSSAAALQRAAHVELSQLG